MDSITSKIFTQGKTQTPGLPGFVTSNSASVYGWVSGEVSVSAVAAAMRLSTDFSAAYDIFSCNAHSDPRRHILSLL